MKVAGGLAEDGVIVGNTYDKYGSRNPIVKRIMHGFESSLQKLVKEAAPCTINEVGCGEGYWVVRWAAEGYDVRGSDFSEHVITIAREHGTKHGVAPERFKVCSIYDVTPDRDSADLIVCCEVLEHLEQPEQALKALAGIVEKDLIISVPREPLWRLLNMTRGKYLGELGNTPGHIQHWSKSGIVQLAGSYFDIEEVLSPLPWTMIHCRRRSR